MLTALPNDSYGLKESYITNLAVSDQAIQKSSPKFIRLLIKDTQNVFLDDLSKYLVTSVFDTNQLIASEPISQILTDNFFYILFTFCYSVIVYVFFFKTFLKSQLFIST